MTRAQFNRLMALEDRRLKRLERSWTSEIKKALKRQGEAYILNGQIDNSLFETLYGLYEKTMLDYAERQLRWLEQGVGNGATKSIQSVEKKDRFFMIWTERITLYLNTYLFSKVQEMDRTTVELIREQTQPLIQSGATVSEIQTAIRSATGGSYSTIRARMIARTELGNAVAQGKKESSDSWESETGDAQGKLWIHRGAKDPRSWHLELDNGRPIPKNEPFSVYVPSEQRNEDMMYPHDPEASAENVINCGCTVVYVRMERYEIEDY